MTNLLGDISKQFGKSLLLGAVLPIVIFLFLLAHALPALVPPSARLFSGLDDASQTRDLITVTIIAVLGGMLFSMLNDQLRGVFEGHPWQNTRLGKALIEREGRRFDALRQSADEALATMRDVRGKDAASYARAVRAWNLAIATMRIDFAGRSLDQPRPHLLPTRLGNTVRAFQDYPRTEYGMAHFALWPRLSGKIDKGYAAMIDDAKTALDFVVHAIVLAVLLGVLLLGGMIYGLAASLTARLGVDGPTPPSAWALVLAPLEICACAAIAILGYRMAIARSVVWGEFVKGAFDLYRNDLLLQLGYKPPSSREGERRLWVALSDHLRVGDHPLIPTPEYAPVRAVARPCDDTNVQLTLDLDRGVQSRGRADERTIILRAINSTGKQVGHVEVREAVPDGCDYVWGSASACAAGSAVPVVVHGGSLLRFTFDGLALAPDGAAPSGPTSVDITYRVLLRVSPAGD